MPNQGKHRYTVGFLIDHTDSQYQFGILQGISDFARVRDVNLICFEGGIIRSTRHFDYERNIIYDLATEKRLDGLIILSDSIAPLLDDDTLLHLAKSYAPLPVIFVGRRHEEVPSVVIDSSRGMQALIHHLVEVHGHRSFAFIKGLEGSYHAKVRHRTLIDTLKAHDLELDPTLVFDGDYMEPAGRAAVRSLLAQGRPMPDVIVACNDEMAVGAMLELGQRNIAVPRDIAVVGFDDTLKCATTDPPLTTVHQPLIKEGWTAIEVLLETLEGTSPPRLTELDTTVVVRESCGCSVVTEDIGMPKESAGADDSRTAKKIRDVLSNVSYDNSWRSTQSLAKALIESYRETLDQTDQRPFLGLWRRFLDTTRHLGRDDILVKEILTALHGLSVPGQGDDPRREALFHVALCILKEQAMLRIRRSHDQTLKENWILNFLRDELDIRLSTDEIVDILYTNLRAMEIRTAYLAMYQRDNGSDRLSQLKLAYDGEKRYDLSDEGYFPAWELLPDAYFNRRERFSFIVESLYYSDKQFGFIILDIGDRIHNTYGVLRRVISSILHGTHMVRQIEQQKNELISTIAKLRTIMGGAIKTLSRTVETRDPYTAGHQRRVSDLSRAIAQRMNLPADTTEGIRVAGIVHDLGKLFTPSEILNKPGALMQIEFELIKFHSEAGGNILRNIEFPWPIATIVLQHHERCDGSGYPKGLGKDEILPEARIIAVADVVEAITSIRPYRAALGLEAALEEITRYRGIKYDEDVVDACLGLFADDNYKMPALE